MFTDPVVTNPFVADGIVPDGHGYRTLIEYRARLYSIPPSFSSTDVNSSPDPSANSASINSAPDNTTTNAARNGDTTSNHRLSSPLPPDVREGERVLHMLARTLDLTTLGPLHPAFFAIMSVPPPLYARRTAQSVRHQHQFQQSYDLQLLNTSTLHPDSSSLHNSSSSSSPASANVILLRSLHSARFLLYNLVNKAYVHSLYAANTLVGRHCINRTVEPNLLSWHWADELLAISTGHNLDKLCAFHFHSNEWEIPGQQHRHLTQLTSIAFRPFSGRALALGGRFGVFLLDRQNLFPLNPNPLDTSHSNISSLDWSPDGHWLASASADNQSVRIWDIATRTCRTLRYHGAFVKFNPNPTSHLLFVADASGTNFRLWDLRNWKAERWGSLSGPVVSAVWSPDGSTLLFSTQNASCVHVLTLSNPSYQQQPHNAPSAAATGSAIIDNLNNTIKGRETAITKVEMTVLPREGPGGSPIAMELDPTGERLAIIYEVPEEESPNIETNPSVRDDPHRRFSIALYSTQFIPSFTMTPIGYINGPEKAGPPVAIKFKPQPVGAAGATLACMWRSGQITFSHLFFNPSRRTRA